MKRYNFYATLLNAYSNYEKAEEDWYKYWGSSDDPSMLLGEFCEQRRKELIDRINRVPFDSDPADMGTAFNEVIDCLAGKRNSSTMIITSNKDNNNIVARYNGKTFYFNLTFCVEFAKRYEWAIPQYKCEAVLPITGGEATLYGYIDEVLPFAVIDIKTTTKYEAFKFRDTWQHKVYPYCLNRAGIPADTFRYDVVVWNKNGLPEVHEEVYNYNDRRATAELIEVCDKLALFCETYRKEITDKKIFDL